jgi:hypothetical protein
VLKEQQVLKEEREVLEQLDHKVGQELKVLKGFKVHKVIMEHKALKVILEERVLKVLLELKELKVLKEVYKEPQELKVM